MSREIKINDLVQVKNCDKYFWIVRNIIGDIVFAEMLCDYAGQKPHFQIANSYKTYELIHAESTLNETIEHLNTTLTTLIAIKNQYAPSNEGYEKET